MSINITDKLIEEHRLILRMLALLEKHCQLLKEGSLHDYLFFKDCVNFVRNYADKFHHAKEEDLLFEALVANGMPRQHSPVAAMLQEHEIGRSYVRALEAAAECAIAGEAGHDEEIISAATAYLGLLREHIAKEDGILYPLAERNLPAESRSTLNDAYLEAERKQPTAAAHYREMVAQYEAILS